VSTRLAVRGPPRAVIAVIADIAAKVDAEAAEWGENRRMSHTGCSGNGRTCSASGGHFSTKSRRYSVTLGALRRARRRWHQITASNDGARLHLADLEAQLLADDDDDDSVIGAWEFAGTGWSSDGDAVLANAAAARAREYAQHRAPVKSVGSQSN